MFVMNMEMISQLPVVPTPLRAKPVFEGYTDSYMAGNVDTKRSTSIYLFTFGGELSLGSPDYRSVLLCLLLRDYIDIIQHCKGMLWIKKWFKENGLKQDKTVVLRGSHNAIHIIKNARFQ